VRTATKVLIVAGVAALVGVVITAATALRLYGNISTLDVGDVLTNPGDWTAETPQARTEAADAPPAEPLNILVMGSDTRRGQGKGFGSEDLIGGARSDTTLLVHLSGDRTWATALSFPRDLVVTIPPCTQADGTETFPYSDRFNAAFSIGGPACTITTVKALTGLPIHHFVVVDFTGFTKVVDALGGVEVCLTRPVQDPLARLDLPAGVTRVQGDQALGFVRARTSLGDGSDLQRIERQQEFMASMVREVTSRELLTNPVRLVRTLDAVTRSLTLDEQLADVGALADLGRSLAGIDPDDVAFVTYPNVYDEGGATVSPDLLHAQPIIDAIAADRPWPPPRTQSDLRVTVPPRDVRLTVVNATGLQDRATEAGSMAELLGYQVDTLTVDTTVERTVVRTDRASRAAARTVAAALETKVVVDDSAPGVRLVLGTDYRERHWRSVVVKRPAGWQSDGDDATAPGGTRTADVATCAS
jgi:LCP family protein required for cell wall assembly